jgi:plastocyanin
VFLARTTSVVAVESEFRLDRPAVEGVLSWTRLYLNDGEAIRELDLGAPLPREVPVRLTPEPRGTLHLVRHGDNLVVAEDGTGLRFVGLPLPREHDLPEHRHMFPAEPTQVGAFALEQAFSAVTSFGHRVYVAAEGGGIIVVDGFDLEHPRRLHELPYSGHVQSMAVNGSRLFLLGSDGLTILDLSDENQVSVEGRYPEIRGRSIALTGRMAHVANGRGGLATFRDRNPLATTHTVNIMGITFNPASVTINPGDTVQWISGGGLPHNVESCDGVADPLQCTGVAVEGQFVLPFPMPATAAPFTVSHTFTGPGSNPYFCIVHVGVNMVGTVNVTAPPPPGVPSGLSGSPLLVGKLAGFPDGSRLALTYDTASCAGNTDHQIIHAVGSRLPTVLGGTYFVSAGVCNIGNSGSFLWSGAPNGPPNDPLVWFLVLAENNTGTEGSWGTDSASNERNGFFAGGSSGQCGITTKDLSNTCGTP